MKEEIASLFSCSNDQGTSCEHKSKLARALNYKVSVPYLVSSATSIKNDPLVVFHVLYLTLLHNGKNDTKMLLFFYSINLM